jgi:hypothetical protein
MGDRTKRRLNRQTTLLLIVLIVIGSAFTSPAHAQRTIKNETGHDRAIMGINDTSGVVNSELYIKKDATMTVDASKDPIKGAGFYQAKKGNYYFVHGFPAEFLGGLHVEKIEWDDDGKTVAITGLDPVLDALPQMKIVSDVVNPKIKGGIHYLKLEDKGDTEYQLKILFGKVVSVTPRL